MYSTLSQESLLSGWKDTTKAIYPLHNQHPMAIHLTKTPLPRCWSCIPEGHIARDLSIVMHKGPMQKALSHILLPIATTDGSQLCSHQVLLPHRFFSALWNADQAAFVDHWCGGSEAALLNFWRKMEGTTLYSTACRMGLKKTIPIKLFGDGVAAIGMNKSWGKSVDAFLMSSLMATTSSQTSEVLTSG